MSLLVSSLREKIHSLSSIYSNASSLSGMAISNLLSLGVLFDVRLKMNPDPCSETQLSGLHLSCILQLMCSFSVIIKMSYQVICKTFLAHRVSEGLAYSPGLQAWVSK